jgi:hypothetical protein
VIGNNRQGEPGNLVLGGFDKSRFTAPGTSIRMPNESNNTLVVGIKSMLYQADQDIAPGGNTMTPKGGFSATIDSTLPYLILPDEVCDEFVEKFGLEYDENNQLYTVNSSSHQMNLRQNANVSFKIGSGPQDSDAFESIVLPYSAFDQQANIPLTDGQATQYFPIKKTDKGIYVLGRTFLQEAYIIVDYERANFTVAPAYYADPKPAQSLVTIFNQSYKGIPTSLDPGPSGGLSAGAIAGIVVGIVGAFIIAAIAAFFLWRKRQATKKTNEMTENPSEIDTTYAGKEIKWRRVSELTGSEAPQSPKEGYYGHDNKSIPPISEMSPESTPAELYSPPPDGRDTFDSYFVAGRMRRRGATRDRDSSGNNTPRTPIAELPGEDAIRVIPGKQDPMNPLQKPPHSRSPSNTSLSTNIDEVLAKKRAKQASGDATAAEPGATATMEEIARATAESHPEGAEDIEDPSTMERRPSHARGLSDTTVQSDSTAVSQPTPEELDRWARNPDDGPARPMSP